MSLLSRFLGLILLQPGLAGRDGCTGGGRPQPDCGSHSDEQPELPQPLVATAHGEPGTHHDGSK